MERTGLVVAAAAIAVSGLLWGPRGFAAAAAGAALACGNLWLMRRLVGRALVRAQAGAGQAAMRGLMTMLVLKLPVLIGLVWIAVGVLGVAPGPFALGLSALVVALVASGVYVGLKEAV
jgi:hypothetical protein